MSDVILFPSLRDPFGEDISAEADRTGLAQAAAYGFAHEDLRAIMDHDRPLASHFLLLISS